MNALSYYQNADGGCGHAVEADCWNPNSTPLHTGTACDILREIDFTDKEHPLVKGMLKWFLSAMIGKSDYILAYDARKTVKADGHAPYGRCGADKRGLALVSVYPLWKTDYHTGQPRRGQDLFRHAACGGLHQPKAFARYRVGHISSIVNRPSQYN